MHLLPLAAALVLLAAPMAVAADASALQQQVWQTERAFARTMADRDQRAFAAHLSAQAVFFAGEEALRGAQAVAAHWQRYFEAAAAPFSWEPQRVEVLDSGDLALSTGPVMNAQGKPIATYTSIWRLEAPGVWRIVFDKGCSVCVKCEEGKP